MGPASIANRQRPKSRVIARLRAAHFSGYIPLAIMAIGGESTPICAPGCSFLKLADSTQKIGIRVYFCDPPMSLVARHKRKHHHTWLKRVVRWLF